jgi:hypothetical protein
MGGGGDFAQMLQMFQQQAAQQMQGGAAAGGAGAGLGGFGAEAEAAAGTGAFGGGGWGGMMGGGQSAGAAAAAKPQPGAGAAGKQQQQQQRQGGGAAGDPLTAYYTQRCQEKHGLHAEYDGDSAACVCNEGYGPDEAEQCVPEDGTEEEIPSPAGGAGAAAAAAAASRQAQAAAAQAASQAQPAQRSGKAGGANAWFSQMWGGKGGAGGGSAAADQDTCPGGVCKNPPAKYKGGAVGASAGAGAGPAIIKVDTLCKHSLGRGSEFDGVSFVLHAMFFLVLSESLRVFFCVRFFMLYVYTRGCGCGYCCRWIAAVARLDTRTRVVSV